MRPLLLRSRRIQLLAILLFVACTGFAQHYYYAPNTVSIPVIREKNDGAISLGLGRGPNYNAREVQGSYSPLNRGAFMINYFDTGNNGVKSKTEVGAKMSFMEAAAGGYYALAKGTASLFGGYGFGKIYNTYAQKAGTTAQLSMERWFIQPGISFRDEFFQCGIAMRLSYLVYTKGDVDYSIDVPELTAIREIDQSTPIFLPELGLSGSIRLKPFLFSLNISSVFPNTDGLNFSRFNIGLFVTLDIGDTIRASQKKKGVKHS